MKSKQYYGIGNDEYNYWKTTDNGKTWNYWKQGAGKVIISDDKIISDGTKVSDDNGDTFETGNIKGTVIGSVEGSDIGPDNDTTIYGKVESDGEFPPYTDEDENKDDGQYDKNTDGDGIYSSTDGKEWNREGPGTGDKIKIKKNKDESGSKDIYIYGKKDVLIIHYDKDGNKTGTSFDIIPSDLYDKFFTMSIDDILIYILNDIILPKLSFMLADQNSIGNLKYDPLKVHETYFTNSEVYRTNFNGIDYFLDVGMRPLTVESLREYKDFEITKNELIDNLSSENEIKEKKIEDLLTRNIKLNKTFQMIDLQLNITKQYALKHELQSITDREEDYEGIKREDVSIMQMYYNIQKGSEESIIGTIINSIFTFNNSKKMDLLKTSIIETANRVKEGINLKLHSIYDKINSGMYSKEDIIQSDYFKKLLNINLKKEWSSALIKCTQDYYLTAINNIYRIGLDNDKNLIAIAADKYKFFRADLMQKAENSVNYLQNKNVVKDNVEIDVVNSSINTIIEEYYNKVSIAINDDNLKEKLNIFQNEYNEKENEIFKNVNIIINNIISELSGSLRTELNDKIYVTGFNDIFDRVDYRENFENLTVADRNKVYNYFIDIINEFKKRCVNLYKISGDNIIPYIKGLLENKTDIKLWSDNLLLSENKTEYINNNPLSKLYNNTNDVFKDINKVIENEWNSMRNII